MVLFNYSRKTGDSRREVSMKKKNTVLSDAFDNVENIAVLRRG